MTNIFLSGNINVGKSTIIQDFLSSLKIKNYETGGFYTKAYLEGNKVKGFYIEPVNYGYSVPIVTERLIGYTPDGERWVGVGSTFENLGVQILDFSLKTPFKLIVMDELGFFENNAFDFQKKVHEVLNSDKKVLGVIKPFSTPFMDSIRNRKDVLVVEITKDNRNDVSKCLAQKFVL